MLKLKKPAETASRPPGKVQVEIKLCRNTI